MADIQEELKKDDTLKDYKQRTGKTKISNTAKKNGSQRAAKGNLLVIDKRCRYCGHHKALHSVPSGRIKCARCTMRLEK